MNGSENEIKFKRERVAAIDLFKEHILSTK